MMSQSHVPTAIWFVLATAMLAVLPMGGERLPSQAAFAVLLAIMLIACALPSPTVILAEVAHRLVPALSVVGMAAALCGLSLAGASIHPEAAWLAIVYALVPLAAVPAAVVALGVGPAFAIAPVVILATLHAVVGIAGLVAEGGFVIGLMPGRNSAAAFLTVGLLCTIALRRLVASPSARSFLVVAGIVMAVALIGTTSRAGIATALVAVPVAWAVGEGRRRAVVATIAALVVATLAAVVLASTRNDDSADSNAVRVELARDAISAIIERPLAGWGAGTYPYVSAAHRSEGPTAGFTWDTSHSVPLDLAATLGIPFALLVYATVIGCAIGLWRMKGTARIASIAVGALAAHSIVDYAPTTLAIALAASLLVGAGVAGKEPVR